jgi:hypothetical protein
VNGICGCGSPARCCQPAVAGGVIYADLRGELSTHLGPTDFVYSEFCCAGASATSFPLSKHTGVGDTAPAFSGWRVCLQLMWEVGLPPSPVEFSSHRCFYKLSCSWLLGVCLWSCLLRLACLFTVLWGIAPPPLFGTQGAQPSLLHVFFILIVCYSVCFFVFPWERISLSRGLCWAGPGLSVGVWCTT